MDEYLKGIMARDNSKLEKAMTSQPMTAVERVARAIANACDIDPDVAIGINGKLPDWITEAAEAALAALTPASEEVEKVAKGFAQRVSAGPQAYGQDDLQFFAEAAALLRRLDAERKPLTEELAKDADLKDASRLVLYGMVCFWRKLNEVRAKEMATLTAELATLRAQAGEKELIEAIEPWVNLASAVMFNMRHHIADDVTFYQEDGERSVRVTFGDVYNLQNAAMRRARSAGEKGERC